MLYIYNFTSTEEMARREIEVGRGELIVASYVTAVYVGTQCVY